MSTKFRTIIDTQQEQEEKERQGDYDGSEPCPNCGRYRLCDTDNGKRRCDKCNWVLCSQ